MIWLQNHLPELAMSAAMAWGAGLRLYLVVFVVGMLGKLGYVPLPDALKLLMNPLVLGAAGFMAFVEFFADKIPWLDSAWDAVHTFLRIPAGAALAARLRAVCRLLSAVGRRANRALQRFSRAARAATTFNR